MQIRGYEINAGAELRGAYLVEADLTGVDMRGADLSKARLAGADLRGADLRRASLICADLRGALLEGADLRGADLTHATMDDGALKSARTDVTTTTTTPTGRRMKSGTFVWISRHDLTAEQRAALDALGYTKIVEPGDADAFYLADLESTVASALQEDDEKPTVGVVHPAAALNLRDAGYTVAVSRNINRAPEGERPRFEFAGWVFF